MVGTEDIHPIMGDPPPHPSPHSQVLSRLFEEASDYMDSEVWAVHKAHKHLSL